MTERTLDLDFVEDMLAGTVKNVENVMVVARGITTVKDKTTVESAAGILSQIADARKQVDAARLATSKPFREEVESINGRFKEILGPLVGIEAALRAMIKDYRGKEQEKLNRINAEAAREAQDAMEVEARRAEKAGVPVRKIEAPEVQMQEAITTATGRKVGTARRWTYTIENPDAVPRVMCEPSRGKISQAIKEGARSIPGVHVYEDEVVNVR